MTRGVMHKDAAEALPSGNTPPDRDLGAAGKERAMKQKDKVKRTLYECSHAKVKGDRMYCDAGLSLSPTSSDGCLDVRRLARGEPLAFGICQGCSDFDGMGPPLPPEERGWLGKGESDGGIA